MIVSMVSGQLQATTTVFPLLNWSQIEDKAQVLDGTGLCDAYVNLPALPLIRWVTSEKLLHLSVHEGSIYKRGNGSLYFCSA